MSMSDPIADLLTRIRNGQAAGKAEVSVQSSRVKEAIVRVLKDEGYLTDFVVSKDGGRKALVIALKYHAGKPVIERLERVSRPGRRVYARKDRLPRVLGGLGTAIMSTSDGLITNRQAAERGVGGEVVAFVW